VTVCRSATNSSTAILAPRISARRLPRQDQCKRQKGRLAKLRRVLEYEIDLANCTPVSAQKRYPSAIRFTSPEPSSSLLPVARSTLKQGVTNRASQFLAVDSYKVGGEGFAAGEVSYILRRSDTKMDLTLQVSPAYEWRGRCVQIGIQRFTGDQLTAAALSVASLISVTISCGLSTFAALSKPDRWILANKELTRGLL
jgi:hypothetical protein